MNKYNITTDSVALEYEEVIALLHKVIENDFLIYFNQSVRPYNCNSTESKAEVLYDIASYPVYFSDDKQYILINNQLNDYGVYAMENILPD